MAFFDRETLDFEKSFDLPSLAGVSDRFFLSANNDNDWQGEVIVGARDEAIMIDWINDLNGNRMWRNQTIWEL